MEVVTGRSGLKIMVGDDHLGTDLGRLIEHLLTEVKGGMEFDINITRSPAQGPAEQIDPLLLRTLPLAAFPAGPIGGEDGFTQGGDTAGKVGISHAVQADLDDIDQLQHRRHIRLHSDRIGCRYGNTDQSTVRHVSGLNAVRR